LIADLTDRVALVTGGGQGVGRAIALVLAEQGAHVAIGDIRAELAALVADEITQSGRQALAVALDVRSRSSARAAVEATVDRWGRLDILVNNAGVIRAPSEAEAAADPDADWDVVFDVNLRGVVNCCDAALTCMASQGYGKIVNISSTAGRPNDPRPPPEVGARRDRPPAGGSAYALSKAAVIRYTQMLASSAAHLNVNVNCVCPTRMVTPMGLAIAAHAHRGAAPLSEAELTELRRAAVVQVNRFGRELEPVDVAKMVAFLASDDARNITGQSINVDGGLVMS
jgi:NAD(P)-dependent dehydrogenase (short-subunit alcohol dehydrogenase family)